MGLFIGKMPWFSRDALYIADRLKWENSICRDYIYIYSLYSVITASKDRSCHIAAATDHRLVADDVFDVFCDTEIHLQ